MYEIAKTFFRLPCLLHSKGYALHLPLLPVGHWWAASSGLVVQGTRYTYSCSYDAPSQQQNARSKGAVQLGPGALLELGAEDMTPQAEPQRQRIIKSICANC